VVSELEKHSHVIFMIVGKKLFLTRRAVNFFTRVTDLFTRTKIWNDLANREQRRLVRFGASATVGSFLLPQLLSHLKRQDPTLEIDFVVGNTAQIESALLHSELDIALVEGRVQSAALRSEVVLKDELVLVGLPDLVPLKRSFSAKLLADLPFLLRESGSGTAEQARETLTDGNYTSHCGDRHSIDGFASSVRFGADCLSSASGRSRRSYA
jgi:DNA-binding transcriptional LysR family regulator